MAPSERWKCSFPPSRDLTNLQRKLLNSFHIWLLFSSEYMYRNQTTQGKSFHSRPVVLNEEWQMQGKPIERLGRASENPAAGQSSAHPSQNHELAMVMTLQLKSRTITTAGTGRALCGRHVLHMLQFSISICRFSFMSNKL